MHPEFLGQGSVTLPEKWEAIRGLQTHFLFVTSRIAPWAPKVFIFL